MTVGPQFALDQLWDMARSDPEKVVLHVFRTIEMFLRDWLKLERVYISEIFDRVRQEKEISELLYQQLRTLNRLRNDVVHRGYKPKCGDGLIALGTLHNFYDDLWARGMAETNSAPPIGEWTCILPDPHAALDKRQGWRDFQEIARRFFEQQAGCRIVEEVPIELPSGPHRFDLASLDKSVVIECKSYTWLKSGKRPSAKWEAAQRTCGLLSETTATRKILVFQDDMAKGKSLAQEFVRLNQSLVRGIQVWRYWRGEFQRVDEQAGPSLVM
jgi:hypothetical protein